MASSPLEYEKARPHVGQKNQLYQLQSSTLPTELWSDPTYPGRENSTDFFDYRPFCCHPTIFHPWLTFSISSSRELQKQTNMPKGKEIPETAWNDQLDPSSSLILA